MELAVIIWLVEVVTNIHMWFNLKSLIGFGGLFVGLSLFMSFLGEGMDVLEESTTKKIVCNVVSYKKTLITVFVVATLGSLWNTVVPSKETAYIMLGAYGVQSAYEVVSSSGEGQRIASKSLSLIETKLDEYIKVSDNEVVEEVTQIDK